MLPEYRKAFDKFLGEIREITADSADYWNALDEIADEIADEKAAVDLQEEEGLDPSDEEEEGL